MAAHSRKTVFTGRLLLLGAWLILLSAFAAVSIMKWKFSRREDDHLHFSESEAPVVNVQAAIAHKLDVLDRWKMTLLILMVAAGLAIVAFHAYTVWQTGIPVM